MPFNGGSPDWPGRRRGRSGGIGGGGRPGWFAGAREGEDAPGSGGGETADLGSDEAGAAAD